MCSFKTSLMFETLLNVNPNRCRKCVLVGKNEPQVSCESWTKPTSWHSRSPLADGPDWHRPSRTSPTCSSFKKENDFVLKLKTILKFCFNTVSSDWAVPQRHYLKDVYDSGMVFYNVFVPRRQAFYTAFKCVCSFPFLSKVLMLILSLLCLRALEGFVPLKIL